MGSAVRKPASQQVGVHLDCDLNSKGIVTNTKKTVAIKDANNFTVPINTVVSAKKIQLSSKVKVKISCTGGGVIRVGLSATDPFANDNILQGSIFEKEEGFGPGETIRMLYKADFTFLCYGPPGQETEYDCERTETDVWLYVICVYGVPDVRAFLEENDKVDADEITLSPMKRDQDNTDILVPNTARCRIREPVVNGDVYHCRWNMKLKNESIAETSPKYGYMSLRLVSRNDNQGENEERIIWERRSAVQEYPFSSVIAFRLSMSEKQVSHNLFVTSVGNTTKDYFEDQVNPGSLHFVIEFSSGQIEVTHGRGLLIAQELGSILLVTGYKFDDEEASTNDMLTEINAKSEFQPRRIQFGDCSVNFLLEFNERLTNLDVTHIQHSLACPVKRLQETDTVQVMINEPDDIDLDGVKYDMEAHFSREQAGGGQIVRTEKDKEMSGCWLVKFSSKYIARKVWMMKVHSISIGEDRVNARVLPVYEGFGLAVNYGEKPVYDTSPLVVSVDKHKLRFIRTREKEKKSFIANINKRIKVDVVWAELSSENEDGEFETEFEQGEDDVQEDDNEPNSITFTSRVPESEWKMLAVWKDITKREVLRYLNKTIQHIVFNVEDDAIDTVLDHLNTLKQNKAFEFDDDLKNKKVTLIGSDYQVLKDVADQAGKKIVIPVTVTEPVSIKVEKYLALDSEGILDQVKNESPYTSFKVNRETVSLKGPSDEVQEAQLKLLSFAINTTTIELNIKTEQAQFLRRNGATLLREEFRKERLNSNFTVSEKENTISVITYTGNGVDKQKKKKDMLGIIDTLIRTRTVNVEKQLLKSFETNEWKQYKQDIEKRVDGHLIILDPRNTQNITVVGTLETCEQAKVEVENYIKRNKRGSVILRVPIEIAEYLDEFQSEDYSDKLECLKDSNGCYTGELSAHDVGKEIVILEDTIRRDIKKINSHWFYIKKSWIASVIQNIVDMQTLSRRERFLMQLDIGHSLAAQGVTGVAIAPKTGRIIQVRQGDILFETTEVIVHSTNGHKSAFERGLGKCIADIGGDDIKTELLQEIETREIAMKREASSEPQVNDMHDNSTENIETELANGKPVSNGFKTGDVIVTGSGRLRCLKIVHAFPPKWIDGSKSEDVDMKNLIRKILQICQDQRLTSVALSAIGCGSANYPIDKAAIHILEAVTEFIGKTNDLTLKEVVICDSSKTAVDRFTKALGTLKDHWFTFIHGKKIEVEDFIASSRRKAESKIVIRPSSGHGTERPPSARPKTPGLRWGRQRGKDENENPQSGQNKPEIIDELKDGLPYDIPITEKLTLHVKKGDLTQQKVNVIVCPTPEFPNLTGEVAKAVMKAGGDTIIQECKSLGIISEGQIKTTGAGRLKFDRICHVRMPKKWNSAKGEFVNDLVSTCLTEAINSGHSAIAFPTIGTGNSGFPADKVANAMIKSICQIGNSFRNSSLTDVTIVVYSMADGVCRIFEEVVPHLFKANTTTGMTISRKGPRSLPRRKTVKYVPPPTFDKHSHVDDVVIVKIVSKGNGKDIQKKIEDIVEKEVITKELNYQKLSKEQTLSELEESALKTLEMKYGISIEIDKPAKCVKLTGLKKRVDNCEFKVVKLLEYDFPMWRLKEWKIRTVGRTVQWYYADGDGKTYPVDAESNYDIHTNYVIGDDFIYHNHTENKKYKMITNDMVEHPMDDPKKRRRLYLRTNIDQEVSLPNTWKISEEGGEVAQHQLNASATEFNDVKEAFIKAGCRPSQIINITRLESKFMWLQYKTKMKQLEKQNSNTNNEKRLWHGTDIDTVPKIIKNGYDRSFAGNANMTAHGKGVYFAVHSAYSDRDQYATRDANGIKRMFWNRVLTGEFCQGTQNMTTLPQRPGVVMESFQVYYDSAVDNVNKPEIFVIFHDTQSYPEYLIEYK